MKTLNTENQNTKSRSQQYMLKYEYRNNVELIKIMTENKTTLPSLRNQD